MFERPSILLSTIFISGNVNVFCSYNKCKENLIWYKRFEAKFDIC